MVRIPFVLAVIAAMGVSGVGARGQKAKEACSLLTVDQIQTFAGATRIGDGVPGPDGLQGSTCQYRWGAGTNVQSGRSHLNISTTEVAKAYPGMNPSLVAQGLLARAKIGQPNAAVIPGLGDAATYESSDPINVVATAITKGHLLIVSFESADARARKDQVIALLKSAAGRL